MPDLTRRVSAFRKSDWLRAGVLCILVLLTSTARPSVLVAVPFLLLVFFYSWGPTRCGRHCVHNWGILGSWLRYDAFRFGYRSADSTGWCGSNWNCRYLFRFSEALGTVSRALDPLEE